MTKYEKKLLLNALEFFVEYRFLTPSESNKAYVEVTNKISQNEYALLCKKMGGKTKWQPVKETQSELMRNNGFHN